MINKFSFILILFLLHLEFPYSGYCQNSKITAVIKRDSEYSGFVQFNLNIFPAHTDSRINIEISQVDKFGKESILSASAVIFKAVLNKKGYESESGIVYESNYTAIKENNIWNDDYLSIGDCSENTSINGIVKLRIKSNYVFRIYNLDEKFFEEKLTL